MTNFWYVVIAILIYSVPTIIGIRMYVKNHEWTPGPRHAAGNTEEDESDG